MSTPHSTAKSPWLSRLLWPLLLVGAFGAGWMLARGDGKEKEPLPPENTRESNSAVMVTVEPVAYRSVQRIIEGVGTLHGFEDVTLAAKVEGRVRRLYHDVADRVKPGELLLEIDPTDYDLSIQQATRALQVELAKLGLKEPPERDIDLSKVPTVMLAQSRMENSRARHERLRRLSMTRATSNEDVDTAASDYRALQAEHANQLLLAKSGLAMIQMKQTALAVTRQQLTDTKVTVPTPTLAGDKADYVIATRTVAEGTLVRPGTELFKLVINRTLKLRVAVPERFSPEVRLGQKVDAFTAAYARPFAGTVTRINPAVETTTRTFEVEVQIPNPTNELKPGNFAKVAIATRTDAQAATVPLTALVNFAGINKVFLEENGRAKEVQVTLGAQTTEWIEIASPPLPQGSKVITSGQTILADQSPVAIREQAGKSMAKVRTEARQ